MSGAELAARVTAAWAVLGDFRRLVLGDVDAIGAITEAEWVSWACRLGTALDHLLAQLDAAPAESAVSGPDLSHGLEDLAGLISFRVGGWHDFGYETPPAPDCKPIPPLGERSAEAIKSAHGAVEAIDELSRQLYALRAQLAGELRQDEGIRMARLDAKYGPVRYADGDR